MNGARNKVGVLDGIEFSAARGPHGYAVRGRAWLGAALVLVGILAAGCAHNRKGGSAGEGFFMPSVPVFLSGPASVLLTNGGGYSAHLVLTTGTSMGRPDVVAGELLSRDSMLLFAQDKQTTEKRARSAGISFIWDVKENHGYMLSEAMQGYAPLGFSVRYTNILARAGGSEPERIEGHRCTEEDVTVSSTEGAAAQIQAWRVADLKGIALRIVLTSKPVPGTLSLSKLRPEAPPAVIFKPPESFTRYENADLMMSELTVRQHNLKKRPAEEWSDQETPRPGSPTNQRPR